ncbi:MAG: DUF4368 domain-containing protein [Clostridia bacterium]|nr:DUF4368 domain-containing protein [Clostridia bacterium]
MVFFGNYSLFIENTAVLDGVSINASLYGYQKEKEKLSSELNAIQNRISTQLQDSKDVDEFISRLKKYAGADKLTREMCLELIEYVIIDENPGRGKSRDIHVYYKFIDEGLNNPNNALD